MIFIRFLDKRIFQPYRKGVVVVRAEEYADNYFTYEYVALSDGTIQVEKFNIIILLEK